MWNMYFGNMSVAKKTVDHILSYMRSSATWAYNGGSRSWGDIGNNGKYLATFGTGAQDRGQMHYRSGLNMIPLIEVRDPTPIAHADRAGCLHPTARGLCVCMCMCTCMWHLHVAFACACALRMWHAACAKWPLTPPILFTRTHISHPPSLPVLHPTSRPPHTPSSPPHRPPSSRQLFLSPTLPQWYRANPDEHFLLEVSMGAITGQVSHARNPKRSGP